MRPFLAQFSEPVWSGHLPSWADFITTTPVFRFSVHTRCPGHFFPPVVTVPLGISSVSARSPRAIFFAPCGALNKKGSDGTSAFQSLMRSVYCGAPVTALLVMIYLRGIARAPVSIQICQSVSWFPNARWSHSTPSITPDRHGPSR